MMNAQTGPTPETIDGKERPTNAKSVPLAPQIDLTRFKNRWSMMRLEAMSKWYQRWRDLSRFINPKRGFFEGFTPNYNAQIDYRLILDGDPAHYARVMASGMMSGLTSPSRPWFRLGLGSEELEQQEDVKVWLETCERILFAIFGKSNIYGAFHQTYEEIGLFGTGAFGIFEDYDSVVRARSYTIGEYFLGTDYAGRINAFARQYWMTGDQMVEEFGWENVSDQVKASYGKGNKDQWFLVYTICEPNTSRIEGIADFRGMKYRSVTWEAQAPDNKPLRAMGYNEFPFMCPRWDMTTTADCYGVGPGWFAIGDIKMLYRMQKDSLLAINKVADPPIIVDSSVEGIANMLPGGVTRSSSVQPNTGVRPAYQVQPDIKALEEKIDKTSRKIASRFYADLFMMMMQSDKTDMTAREVVERHEEKLLMLGPVLERVENEMLSPTIERTFAIALRAGIIPPPPASIQGLPLKVEFISLLAQAQKMVGTAAIEQVVSFAGNLLGAFPDVKDNVDADEAIRDYAAMIGAPKKIIRSKDDVAKIRNARVKQMAEQQAQQDSMAAVQGAKVLADTKVGGGSALEHILGLPPGGAPGGGQQ
jgi:hypothetical protein